MDKEKIAFFDFCETLVDFQTADAFVHFVRQNHGTQKMYRRHKIYTLLKKSYILLVIDRILHCSANKKVILWQLKGQSLSDLETFAEEYYYLKLVNHKIDAVVDKMKALQSDGYRTVLVSGGYDIYLKVFAKNNKVNTSDIISTKIGFKNGRCTGRIEGIDCMGKNKIKLIERMFNKQDILSVSLSDSKSDLPLLLWTNDCYVVSHKKKQKWAVDNKLKEIIW